MIAFNTPEGLLEYAWDSFPVAPQPAEPFVMYSADVPAFVKPFPEQLSATQKLGVKSPDAVQNPTPVSKSSESMVVWLFAKKSEKRHTIKDKVFSICVLCFRTLSSRNKYSLKNCERKESNRQEKQFS